MQGLSNSNKTWHKQHALTHPTQMQSVTYTTNAQKPKMLRWLNVGKVRKVPEESSSNSNSKDVSVKMG